MFTQSINNRTFVIPAFIITLAAWRIATYFFDHTGILFTCTPLYAAALFSAGHLRGYFKPVAVPLLALLISDLVLCFTVYSSFREGLLYPGWYWVYASFVLITLSGKFILRKINIKNILTAIVAASVIHWLVATLSECIAVRDDFSFLSLYATRLVSAAAYEAKLFTGTILYSALLFGGFEWMKQNRLSPVV